jgi:hypothetical protein
MKPYLYHLRRAFSTILKAAILILFSSRLNAQSNACATATVLTSGTSCVTTAGTTTGATYVTGTGNACGNQPDVWYQFVAQTTNPTITLAGNNQRRFELFSGTCGSLTSITCGVTSSYTASGLTIGATYYIRVYANNGTNISFTICVVDGTRPSNDNCSSPIGLSVGSNCTTTRAMLNARGTTGLPNDCAPAGAPDVWFSFSASSQFPNIVLSNLGADFTAAGAGIQLFSGTCGSLTSIVCKSGLTLDLLSDLGGSTGLTIGTTYYVRVFANTSSMAGTTTGWNFRICLSNPVTTAPTVDYGKSYINVTKQGTGGTIEPNDVLEIRATFVVRTNNAYAVSFTDNLPSNTTYVPGTLRILTNEGKIFRQWTDAADSDPASISGSTVTINIGNGANSSTGGPVRSTDRPTIFGTTCVLIASYRVQVNSVAYGTTVSVGGGSLSYRNQPASAVNTITFPAVNAMVYRDFGICNNAVQNSLLSESGGTFGSGTTKDRTASSKVPTNYSYATFGANAPGDYYYGMSNNTSAGTTASTYSIDPNETNTARRVFSVWDIIGDHTGASNPLLGNLPADVNNGQSGGYMVVINASYRTDTAFKDTVRNLCPNTSYEYSAWFRNICRTCGADSLGRGSTTAGYEPTAPGDSSGVRPTLTFNINGHDYYSTGDIYYTGQWVKKGFTYRTGPGETEMIISIRNNAPGGGGNDWAIDDIAVSTCLPDMSYSPSLNPNVCTGNPLTIYDTIRGYYDNYTYHIWQRSTDNGVNWTDLGASRDSIPVYNSTLNRWEYVTAYTIPTTNTNVSDSGDLYRVLVATTSSNLSSPACRVTDGISIINLSVMDCGPVLKTDLLSFNGRLSNRDAILNWSTSKEDGLYHYIIERSYDGQRYTPIGHVDGYASNASINRYSFTDAGGVVNKAWYRIVMQYADGSKKYSGIVQLRNDLVDFTFGTVINPFANQLRFDVYLADNSNLLIELIDMNGKTIHRERQNAFAGVNSFTISNTDGLQSGAYTLRVINKDRIIHKRVVKASR